MHRFRYKRNILYCEDVSVYKIAKAYGTPLYIYSKNTLLDHYRRLKLALRELNPLICFSVKSNSNLFVLKTLVDAGCGLDIVSGGELYRAKCIGASPDRIVFAGVGKLRPEILDAIRYGILFFNVESEEELEEIDKCASSLGCRVNVALRINPDIPVSTHRYIKTGMAENKFGMEFKTAGDIFRRKFIFKYIDIKGVHIHIGSQILSAKPFVRAIKRVLDFIKKNKIDIEYLNIGGGLGIVYSFEKPETPYSFARSIIPVLKKSNLKIILEPGRFISGNSGILVTKVIYRKMSARKKFVVVDSGMSDFIRPSLYHAYHTIAPVIKKKKRKKLLCDIVGPICESGDFLARERYIELPEQDELLAVMGAGAYGFSMASNYNSRPRPCEVMVDGDRFFIIKERETYRDLVRGERALG